MKQAACVRIKVPSEILRGLLVAVSIVLVSSDSLSCYLLAHRRHILASNFPPFNLTDEQPDGVILANDENEGIADAARLDSRPRGATVEVLDALSFCTI